MSTSVRPQVGHEMTSGPRRRRPSAARICQATLHLFDRVAGQAHADRVADAVGQQRADADGALDRAAPHGAGLRHAHVQRRVGLRRQQPVRGDGVGHATRTSR